MCGETERLTLSVSLYTEAESGARETRSHRTNGRSANTLMLEALHPDAHRILIPRTTMYITHQIKSRCMRHCTPRRQRTHGGGGATGADGPPSPARRRRRVCKRRAMRLAGSACCSPRRAPRPCAPLWTMTAIWPPHRATTTLRLPHSGDAAASEEENGERHEHAAQGDVRA